MITWTLACLVLPERLYWICIPLSVVEVIFIVFYCFWRSETKEMPRLHYRTFRRIERMAPEKWEPASYDSTGTVQYNESTYMHGSSIRIAMKTYPEALICKFLYGKQYAKRRHDQKINRIMEECVTYWKGDIAAYQSKAEAQVKKAREENAKIQDTICYWRGCEAHDE